MKLADGPKKDPGKTYPLRMYLAFAGLAALSCLGLDFLAARRGEPAYDFNSRREANASAKVGQSDRTARTPGEPEPAKDGLRAGAAYPGPAPPPAAAPVTPAAPVPTPPASPEAALSPGSEKTAAIIIDDMGNSLEALREIFDLDLPITVAVLPGSAFAVDTARAAHERRLDVLLHLPCESLNHQEAQAPASPVVCSGMPPDEIRTLVADSLDSVPFVVGVNNHMGSKLTQDREAMVPVLDVIKERSLFFIDSVTGARSIAYDQARRMGIPSACRQVFLDSEVGTAYSRDKLVELFRLARKHGRALAIGHPFPETLRALREIRELARKQGVRLVPASAILTD